MGTKRKHDLWLILIIMDIDEEWHLFDVANSMELNKNMTFEWLCSLQVLKRQNPDDNDIAMNLFCYILLCQIMIMLFHQ